MDIKEEYHDPDYAGTSSGAQEVAPAPNEEDRIAKIKNIIRREFENELEMRENEIMVIDQRMGMSRRMLHRLRYSLVNTYYRDQKLQLTAGQLDDELATHSSWHARAQVSQLLRGGQRRLHPSVRKLLGGRRDALTALAELVRPPRRAPRKDYSAMVQTRNYTVAADSTKSLRPADSNHSDENEQTDQGSTESSKVTESSSRQPVQPVLQPTKVLTIDEATRNKTKHRYRIIIGNTSKYAPAASSADRSTHKWLLYVRGPPSAPDLSAIVSSVTARLHHSYAPHHTLTLTSPPFHISRRGWGEFPVRLQLHFAWPSRNPPLQLEHTLRLDRHYTGLQTLGAETLVDVWLYSTPEMLQYAYTEPAPAPPTSEAPPPVPPLKQEAEDPPTAPPPASPAPDVPAVEEDSWMDFFTKDTTELDVDEMIIKPPKQEPPEEALPALLSSVQKRIVKYIDPSTGKIYYLEMDRELDLTKVQEIVINNTKAKISPIKSNGLKSYRRKRAQESLLKPEITNSVVCERDYAHIANDHCYLGAEWSGGFVRAHGVAEHHQHTQITVKQEPCIYDTLCASVLRMPDVRTAVNYLLRRIPLVDESARDPDYAKYFPFVAESEDEYWKLDVAKRRNMEWSRAKLVSRLAARVAPSAGRAWSAKHVLRFARLQGLVPALQRPAPEDPEALEDWSSLGVSNGIRRLFPSASDVSTLTLFSAGSWADDGKRDNEHDEEVEVEAAPPSPRPPSRPSASSAASALPALPVSHEDRLRFLFIERKCADIGIELRNEDVGHGFEYSAVHAVLLSALRSFADELVRAAVAVASEREPLWHGLSSSRALVSLEHVYMALGGVPPTSATTDASAASSSTSAAPRRATGAGRLQLLCGRALATTRKDTYSI